MKPPAPPTQIPGRLGNAPLSEPILTAEELAAFYAYVADDYAMQQREAGEALSTGMRMGAATLNTYALPRVNDLLDAASILQHCPERKMKRADFEVLIAELFGMDFQAFSEAYPSAGPVTWDAQEVRWQASPVRLDDAWVTREAEESSLAFRCNVASASGWADTDRTEWLLSAHPADSTTFIPFVQDGIALLSE